ncbi:hypothetical protein MJO28_000037 [Puccinia striiformis f. sp. tritici]|uniref:Uncharacterized protein n=1 Tax=Puccinia striiformis f. sp. tritici TaxID=168172 RepID=A0ACC0EZU9_9BASI|nr:hypothetical protein MJO28_000037 [Puccinia striiformis f. sp. tritici]
MQRCIPTHYLPRLAASTPVPDNECSGEECFNANLGVEFGIPNIWKTVVIFKLQRGKEGVSEGPAISSAKISPAESPP